MCGVCGCGKLCNCAGCTAVAAKFESQSIMDVHPAEPDDY